MGKEGEWERERGLERLFYHFNLAASAKLKYDKE